MLNTERYGSASADLSSGQVGDSYGDIGWRVSAGTVRLTGLGCLGAWSGLSHTGVCGRHAVAIVQGLRYPVECLPCAAQPAGPSLSKVAVSPKVVGRFQRLCAMRYATLGSASLHHPSGQARSLPSATCGRREDFPGLRRVRESRPYPRVTAPTAKRTRVHEISPTETAARPS